MKYHFTVSGEDLAYTGKASTEVKKILARLGVSPESIRRTAIIMYEGETNLAIHAGGGDVDVDIDPERVEVVFEDHGPGIPDLDLAMTEGWSSAPEWIREQGFGAGMGLPNMKRNSDGFDIHTQVGVGTKIIMVIKFN
jgi:anti-sigma regulatory factor (Ser/Thr protein kinase)